MQPSPPTLELGDIQGAVLKQPPLRGCGGGPQPYAGSYFVLRIGDAAEGRALLQRMLPYVASAADWWTPTEQVVISVALSFQGLKALGLPQASLDSFPPEFQQGMAARADKIGDVGESSPANWEKPFGTPDVHLALVVVARNATILEAALANARTILQSLPRVAVLSQIDIAPLPTGRTHLGYHDGIGQPLIEGSDEPSYPGQGPVIKAGELILGYPDQLGQVRPMPQPAVLGRNGTYLAVRKLHERVAAFRQFLRRNADSPAAEELLAAKLVGRWRSGAPLMLAPTEDDPALGADPHRNNDFRYFDDDPAGLKCPVGAHIRRANPRDGLTGQVADVNIHRILRRGGSYGPMLPEGVLEDDGQDRGIVFLCMGTSLVRQYEFVKSQWLNDGNFVGLDTEKDAIVGANDGTGSFTIPRRPIRQRLQNVPRFVIARGGEYCFVPSLSALRWMAALGS